MNGYIDILAARAELYERAEPSPLSVEYSRHNHLDMHLIAGFCGCYAVLPILIFDGGFFDFADAGNEDATLAAVIEVYGADGETTIDLAAWPLDHPRRVLCMYRRAPFVGMLEALSPYTYALGSPLILHRSPLEWLQAGCRGAAILTPHLAARAILDLPGRIAAQDAEHAREIDKMVRTLFDRHQVVVPRIERDAA